MICVVSDKICHDVQQQSRTILSGWTLRGAVQQFIDVYVSQATFAEVERAFPYLVARKFASGGGDVRDSQYNALVTTLIRFIS